MSSKTGMEVLQQHFQVAYSFPVFFTSGALAPENPALRSALAQREPNKCHRVCVVVDSGVAEAWPDLGDKLAAYAAAHPSALRLAGEPLVVPGGEASKQSPALIEQLQDEFRKRQIDRHSFVLIIGGGAVLDAVGFAAATTHRGVRVVRMPTTVLSQNDSGVGVKNGINAFDSKNFLGTFAPPFAVINDADFLATLPARDLRAGLAETVKAALIRDQAFFQWLERSRDALTRFEPEATALAIHRTAEIHMQHMARGGDPFEQGSARPLDFGHWAAHKLETLTHHALRHGEAVAIGMMLDSRYSAQVGLLPEADAERIWELLSGLGFRLFDDALQQVDFAGKRLVLDGLREFREHLGGELTITLLEGIGRGVEVHEIDLDQLESALQWMAARERSHAGR